MTTRTTLIQALIALAGGALAAGLIHLPLLCIWSDSIR